MIENELQLENTLEKVRGLEEQYERARQRPVENNCVRGLTLQSLRRLINQFKEEIARYRAGIRPDTFRPSGIESDEQLANTRRKLLGLEQQLAQALARPSENARVHELSVRSLKQAINQLKEEIVRYEAKTRVA